MSMTLRGLLALLALLLPAAVTSAQSPVQEGSPNADRPISAIIFEGLQRVTEQEVRNNIRAAVGDPYDPRVVLEDVHRLVRLGQFKYIVGLETLREDGTVAVTYRFTEQQIIAEVQVVGNRLIPDADLLAVVSVVPRGPRDNSLIQLAKRRIEELYRKRGHYLTTVQIDETELDKSGLLILRVIEGPRVKVKAVDYEGNQAFSDDQLNAQVKTRTALLILRKGELDEELLTDDVAALNQYYLDRGYLDVRVDRRVELSPDNKEAKVVFIVAEGEQYRLRSLRVQTPDGSSPRVFAPEQIAAIIELKTGDVYSGDLLRQSREALMQAYGLMSYVDVKVESHPRRVEDAKAVDLVLVITEGARCVVGEVHITGNTLTRDNVIRRELRGIRPGLPIDGTQLIESENRIQKTRLFSDARITLQQSAPEDPETRDVLVEVKERNTGSVNFGVAVGSDSGLFGEFSLDQRNFDISDYPETLREFISGKAFRGAGQQFNFTVRPGTELFQITASWTEPRLFDSDYSLSTGVNLRTRYYDQYDEDRIGFSASIGRRFGDIWAAAVRGRIEQVELSNIIDEAPTEVFDDAGPNILTDLGLTLTRTTVGTARRPGNGSRLELALDQYGPFGGDFTFTSATSDYTVFFTLHEDFLGRRSVLRLNNRMGYIFAGEAPVYEQFYLGGRSFRGFDYRTISPKGIRADNGLPSDEPVGGEWMFFLGAQYEFPLFGDALMGVVFLDTGTVTDDVGFDAYRVAVGAGLRIYIPQFGDVPIALDFGIPLLSEDDDDESIFSFSAELPF